MSTRSAIGLEYEDSSVRAIYCHFDGHLYSVGQCLAQHWSTPERVTALLELGDLSSLGKKLGGSQRFRPLLGHKEDYCVAYGRDRGDTGTEAMRFANAEDYRVRSEGIHDGYCYLMRKDGSWEVSLHREEFAPLAGKLARL